MTFDVLTLFTTLVTDPVYGIPLTLWVVAGVLWLAYGKGTFPPMLLPHHANRVRPKDPVSAMYWALREHRYSEAVLFSYQRLSGAFTRRYHVAITEIPWRRKKRLRLGIEDPRPFNRIIRDMVKALDAANRLERPPTIVSYAQLRRRAREADLDRRLRNLLADLDWMIPLLEARP